MFPILSFHLDVPILGQRGFLSVTGKKETGKEVRSYPKHLGMEGDKVRLNKVTRGVFCVFTCGGVGREGSIGNK